MSICSDTVLCSLALSVLGKGALGWIAVAYAFFLSYGTEDDGATPDGEEEDTL